MANAKSTSFDDKTRHFFIVFIAGASIVERLLVILHQFNNNNDKLL